jgi:ubiquinone/menaquinone biosynthesis C-methylase UbiE
VSSTHHHPLFARLYPRISHAAEQRGGAGHRRALLEGLQGSVVEIGAGHGVNFAYYPPGVTHVLAVEPEPRLFALARRASESSPVPVQVTRATAEALPVEDASFDAAVVSLVLCTVADQSAALREIRRVLAPRGELRFYEHVVSERPVAARIQRALDATIYPPLAGGCRCARDTRAAIGSSGFAIEREQRFSFKLSPVAPAIPHILGMARAPGQASPQRSSRDSLRSLSTRPSVWQAGQ